MRVGMRLLYAGNFDWPAEQARSIQTIHTTHALARHGAHVRLLTMRPAGRQALGTGDALAAYGLAPHPSLRIQTLPTLRIPETCPGVEIHKRLAVTNLSYCAGAALVALTQRRRGRPDWVVARDPRVAWTLIRLRSLTRVPVVYEIHELFGTRPRDNRSMSADEQWGVAERTRGLESYVLRRADRLITLTEACRRLVIEEYGIDPMRVRTIPDGTAISGASSRVSEKANASVCYVGQLYRWKGVDTLIQAMRDLPGVTLSIIGSGARERGVDVDRERLQSMAQSLNLDGQVQFVPFVPYREVPSRLAGCAVAVVPLPDVLMSRYFTSPLKLFDYMAAGVPIVASDLPSIREVLEHEQNALLVRPDDPTALAAGLRRILNEPRLAGRLADRARSDVAQYSWDRRAERVLDFLRD